MKIVAIQPFSPAAESKLAAGDTLMSINGHRIHDTIDYQFYSAEEDLEIKAVRKHVAFTEIVTKDSNEELGLDLEPMKIRACANDCIFCFADQNPPGVRESLNFRDGDYRFSFLHGHFITMTNMGQKQLDRVVEQKLSPLYISIHVTDPDVRQRLMLYRRDDSIMDKLRYLTSNGIVLHTQIVLCPGWNDGEVLKQTIRDLHSLTPELHTVSIVPVGLTKWRQNLPEIASVTPDYAREFIDAVKLWESDYTLPDGSRFLYLSDEWFILAGTEIPGDEYYDEYSMVENGVGQCRDLDNRLRVQAELLPKKLRQPTHLVFVCGTLTHEFLKQTLEGYLDNITNLTWDLVAVKNDWLGPDLVTVTGLLPGRDVVMQLQDRHLGDAVYLSHRMFNEDGITLDDLDRETIEARLNVPVHIHQEDLVEILEPWA